MEEREDIVSVRTPVGTVLRRMLRNCDHRKYYVRIANLPPTTLTIFCNFNFTSNTRELEVLLGVSVLVTIDEALGLIPDTKNLFMDNESF